VNGQPTDPKAELQPEQDVTNTEDPDLITLSVFSEPVQLSSLVDLVAKTLEVNITIIGDLPGSVVFNAPVPVRKDDLIPLLDSLLEPQGFTITRDRFGFYSVHTLGAVSVNFSGEQATTRVFSTPNIRPSALKAAIEGQLGVAPAGAGGQRQTAYIDDLGIIIITDTPRRVFAAGELIERILDSYSQSAFTRLELKYIAANVARERALQLVGVTGQPTRTTFNPGQDAGQPVQAPGRAGVSLDNIGERLTVDPQGNALIFRGLPDEVEQIRSVLSIIDVANTLIPKQYFAGSAAAQIADIARQRGLGEITTISARNQLDPNQGFDYSQVLRQQQQQNVSAGGPVMVVDEGRGTIIYYGTEAQQSQLDSLIKELDTEAEKVVVEAYKLKNSDAEQVAEVILGLIQNSTPVGESPLLPGGNQLNNRNPLRRILNPTDPAQAGQPQAPGDTSLSIDSGGFVIADTQNNQILVKAPTGQQPEFAKLIEKLDLRRPQVYIQASIVAVTWSDDMRLAFETQFTDIAGSGASVMTDFGLATTTGIGAAKTVATGLGGLTAALVKSDQVPIIINALQTKADARILSTPQLLVDDNEEAQIVSVDAQPTTATSQSDGNNQITSFAGYEEAGTTLTVTPQISGGGYLRLKYEAELSSFTGVGTATVPAPKQTNTLMANSVTIPGDTTVVVGGLTFESKRKTVAQIPLLGDIPLIGFLFQDQNTGDRKTTLYIFLTPRILRDPTFADLRLITRGPQADSELAVPLPRLHPTLIDINPTSIESISSPPSQEAPQGS